MIVVALLQEELTCLFYHWDLCGMPLTLLKVLPLKVSTQDTKYLSMQLLDSLLETCGKTEFGSQRNAFISGLLALHCFVLFFLRNYLQISMAVVWPKTGNGHLYGWWAANGNNSLKNPLVFPLGQESGHLQLGNQMARTLWKINMESNMQCHSMWHFVYSGGL